LSPPLGSNFIPLAEDRFMSGELMENSVRSILEHTAEDGKKYQTKNNDRRRNQNG